LDDNIYNIPEEGEDQEDQEDQEGADQDAELMATLMKIKKKRGGGERNNKHENPEKLQDAEQEKELSYFQILDPFVCLTWAVHHLFLVVLPLCLTSVVGSFLVVPSYSSQDNILYASSWVEVAGLAVLGFVEILGLDFDTLNLLCGVVIGAFIYRTSRLMMNSPHSWWWMSCICIECVIFNFFFAFALTSGYSVFLWILPERYDVVLFSALCSIVIGVYFIVVNHYNTQRTMIYACIVILLSSLIGGAALGVAAPSMSDHLLIQLFQAVSSTLIYFISPATFTGVSIHQLINLSVTDRARECSLK
jgi:hypothetical protein